MVFFPYNAVMPVNKMAKWLRLSLSPWKLFNIVMTTSNRGEKIKRVGGTLKGAVIEDDSTNPGGSSEWTSIPASFSSASAHPLSWISLKPSVSPPPGRCSANGAAQVWGKLSSDGCVLIKSSKYSVQPNESIQMGNYHRRAPRCKKIEAIISPQS